MRAFANSQPGRSLSQRVVRFATLLVMLLCAFALLAGCEGAPPDANRHAGLPPEALHTLAMIRKGGPYPYRKDGTVFQNRERLLPAQARGYYREYTVPTPGARDRGARRIVSGGDPPREFWYTDDHYRSFRPIEPPP